MTKLVYLCGPISGLSYDDARDGWRRRVATELERAGVGCLSPMRFKDYLSSESSLAAAGYAGHVLSTPRGIVARDRYDTQRCDLVFCNLLGAERVSIGSMIEFGWCDSMRIPLLVCMEDEGNLHDHAMVREIADYITPTVEAGVAVVRAILTPGA